MSSESKILKLQENRDRIINLKHMNKIYDNIHNYGNYHPYDTKEEECCSKEVHHCFKEECCSKEVPK
jgi:hypothetical protein